MSSGVVPFARVQEIYFDVWFVFLCWTVPDHFQTFPNVGRVVWDHVITFLRMSGSILPIQEELYESITDSTKHTTVLGTQKQSTLARRQSNTCKYHVVSYVDC